MKRSDQRPWMLLSLKVCNAAGEFHLFWLLVNPVEARVCAIIVQQFASYLGQAVKSSQTLRLNAASIIIRTSRMLNVSNGCLDFRPFPPGRPYNVINMIARHLAINGLVRYHCVSISRGEVSPWACRIPELASDSERRGTTICTHKSRSVYVGFQHLAWDSHSLLFYTIHIKGLR